MVYATLVECIGYAPRANETCIENGVASDQAYVFKWTKSDSLVPRKANAIRGFAFYFYLSYT